MSININHYKAKQFRDEGFKLVADYKSIIPVTNDPNVSKPCVSFSTPEYHFYGL